MTTQLTSQTYDIKPQQNSFMQTSQTVFESHEFNFQSENHNQPSSPSSNIKSAFQLLSTLITRINYHNTIQSLNEIKQRECLRLKCQILTKTLNKILHQKMEEYKRTSYQNLVPNSTLRLDTHSHFDYRVKQSLETSLGMESVAWSLQIQKPKTMSALCQNCKKQISSRITPAPTIARPFVLESQTVNIQVNMKQIQAIQPEVFIESIEHIPNKIINLLPNQLLNQVQDKNTSFINIEMPLFLEMNSSSNKLIESVRQLQLVTMKQISSELQNQPFSIMIPEQIRVQPPSTIIAYEGTPVTPSHQFRLLQINPFQNTSILIQYTPEIQKSFIDTLKIEQSKHSGGPMSPRHERIFHQIPSHSMTTKHLLPEKMLESQILPVNYDTRDLFVKSIELNRGGNIFNHNYNNTYFNTNTNTNTNTNNTNHRTYSLPKKNHYFYQKFTDSQIKRHLFENKKIPSASESFSIEHRREVEERVGGTRSNTHHQKPTFFETAYYF